MSAVLVTTGLDFNDAVPMNVWGASLLVYVLWPKYKYLFRIIDAPVRVSNNSDTSVRASNNLTRPYVCPIRQYAVLHG